MKCLINVLWYCWIAAAITFLCWQGYRGYDLYAEERSVAALGEEGADLNAVLVLDGNIDNRSLELAELYYRAVPKEIRAQFAADGWKLVITDRDISAVYYNGPVKGEIAGLANSKEKKIYIHEKPHHIRNALLHEFGHYVDCRAGIISGTDTFKLCFDQEKNAFDKPWNRDTHAMSNEVEYFAESFQQYILDSAAFKEIQPLTYAYIESLKKIFK